MGYSELYNFNKSDIESQYEVEYININRVKTGKSYVVPLLSKAKEILEHFDYDLPVQSNQKMNVSLKKILKLIGVSKNVTLHSLRKTFASTVLLNRGVPMDVVSKLLGHQSVKTTEESYAKFDRRYILEQINRII